MTRFKDAAPRWIMFTVNPAPIMGQMSISRYANMAVISPGLMRFSTTAAPPTPRSINVVNPDRNEMNGKKKPNILARDKEASR